MLLKEQESFPHTQPRACIPLFLCGLNVLPLLISIIYTPSQGMGGGGQARLPNLIFEELSLQQMERKGFFSFSPFLLSQPCSVLPLCSFIRQKLLSLSTQSEETQKAKWGLPGGQISRRLKTKGTSQSPSLGGERTAMSHSLGLLLSFSDPSTLWDGAWREGRCYGRMHCPSAASSAQRHLPILRDSVPFSS